MFPFSGFCLKSKHALLDFVAMLTLGIVDEELLIELRVGNVSKPLIVCLLPLLQPILIIIIVLVFNAFLFIILNLIQGLQLMIEKLIYMAIIL